MKQSIFVEDKGGLQCSQIEVICCVFLCRRNLDVVGDISCEKFGIISFNFDFI